MCPYKQRSTGAWMAAFDPRSDDNGQFPDALVPFCDLYVATTWYLVRKRCTDFGELLSRRSAGTWNSDF